MGALDQGRLFRPRGAFDKGGGSWQFAIEHGVYDGGGFCPTPLWMTASRSEWDSQWHTFLDAEMSALESALSLDLRAVWMSSEDTFYISLDFK